MLSGAISHEDYLHAALFFQVPDVLDSARLSEETPVRGNARRDIPKSPVLGLRYAPFRQYALVGMLCVSSFDDVT